MKPWHKMRHKNILSRSLNLTYTIHILYFHTLKITLLVEKKYQPNYNTTMSLYQITICLFGTWK